MTFRELRDRPGVFLLIPRLNIRGALHLDLYPIILQIPRRPLVLDSVLGYPKRLGDQVFREKATVRVAKEVGGRPLPEVEDVEVGQLGRGLEFFFAGIAFRFDVGEGRHNR